MKEISWNDFSQVEFCAGTIIKVSGLPEARKAAWKLLLDFGTEIGARPVKRPDHGPVLKRGLAW